MMQELTSVELKEISFKVLCEFDEICRSNGFEYSLAYGTLLGAVRHKGFIPWDDDIDVMMPREDYAKFIEYCKNNDTQFGLSSSENNPKYAYIFAKAYDKNTTVVYDNVRTENIGVQVDIFPIDELGDSIEEATANFKKSRFGRELLVAWNWKRFERSVSRAWYIEPVRFCFYLLSRFYSNIKLANSIKKHYVNKPKGSCEYVGIICGAYRQREILHKSVYTDFIDIEFENRTLKSIKNYDGYLTAVYGDYMKLPPEEKRVSHHNFKAYKNNDNQVK